MVISLQEGLKVDRRYPAIIRAEQTAELGFEVAGRVSMVAVEIGDQVRKGAVIARLQADRLRAASNEARAQVAEAKALLDQYEAELARQTQLRSRDATSGRAVDDAHANVLTGRARLKSAQASLDLAAADLRDTVLRAPFSGLVIERQASVGDLAQAQTPIVTMIESGSLEARASLPVDVARALRPGSSVNLFVDDLVFSGRVKSVLPTVSDAAQSATIIVSIPQNASISEGKAAEIAIEQSVSGEGIWVPVTALVSDLKGLFAIQVVEEREAGWVVRRVPVEVLYSSSDRAYVSGSFKGQAEVIAGGSHRVLPGQVVETKRVAGRSVEPTP
ncbi:efflux RND transporter periplasmic adaptor subunit [Erythrobacter sp. KY5]|uniref:efflux RND transporter periplasmic adaptor subunit n=1 Tax=Erythrobacter sp. KY5 TaxID=2011159 RepID=UPI0013A69FD2|nr:efflux RND transporter periplasmic adaptor subunit [Erythrobacter sp. KY5]